jgi:ketosteroid isomerase-like protein
MRVPRPEDRGVRLFGNEPVGRGVFARRAWSHLSPLHGLCPESSRDNPRAMSWENVEVVRTLFDMFARRDHEAAFDYYDAEIEWDASRAREVGDLDTAGVYHGHDGVRAYWRRWLSAWEDVEATEVEFVDGGQTVVALIHQQRLRGRGSGIEVDTPPYALAFVFRNGKVVRWVFYPRQAEALEAAGLSE